MHAPSHDSAHPPSSSYPSNGSHTARSPYPPKTHPAVSRSPTTYRTADIARYWRLDLRRAWIWSPGGSGRWASIGRASRATCRSGRSRRLRGVGSGCGCIGAFQCRWLGWSGRGRRSTRCSRLCLWFRGRWWWRRKGRR